MRIRKLCIVVACIVLVGGLPINEISAAAKGNSVEVKTQDRKTIDKKIKEIKEQKKTEERKLQNAKKQIDKLKKEERAERKEYEGLLSTVDMIKREEELLDKAIREAKARCDEHKKKLQVRIRAIYKNSNMSYLRIMAESKSFTDFASKVKIMSRIFKSDRELFERVRNDLMDIEYKKSQRETERYSAVRKVDETKRNMERVKLSRAKVDDSILALKRKLKKLEMQEDELIRKSNELAEQIRALQGKTTKWQAGKMLWPLPSSKRITSPFGTRIHPIFKTKKVHHGVDIGASMGSSIVAAKDGKVIIAGWQGGYGNVVIIDHGGGITSVYAHCSKLIARVGQHVKMGEVIAKVGSTGYSTGPHLHFEVRKNGTVVNPLDYTNM